MGKDRSNLTIYVNDLSREVIGLKERLDDESETKVDLQQHHSNIITENQKLKSEIDKLKRSRSGNGSAKKEIDAKDSRGGGGGGVFFDESGRCRESQTKDARRNRRSGGGNGQSKRPRPDLR